MPKAVVQADTVLEAVGKTTVQPTFVERAGLWLALGVGAIIAIVTIWVAVFLYAHYPQMPASDTLKQAADSKAALEQYKELSGIAVKSAQDLFQTIVTQTLLPVLMAILGYIFARRGKDSSE